MHDPGNLEILWFGLIALLWTGYFVLEGFDFGVGMLLRAIGRDRDERRAVMETIGPVWDGNEVWLIAAGGATFAAFPDWYATLFSGLYVPLFAIVAGLVLRPVAFEVWGKEDGVRWRATWEWALLLGSTAPAFLWGVVFADAVNGVPIDARGSFTGSQLDLVGPYALLGGLTWLLLCLSHGAVFLTLRTRDGMLARSWRAARLVAPAAAAAAVAFLAWTLAHAADRGAIDTSVTVAASGAVVAAVAVPPLVARRRAGWAFAASAIAIALLVATLFLDLYPNVLVSSTDPANTITIAGAASGDYTLEVMTAVAAVMLPVVLACQAFVYWVFRGRVSAAKMPALRLPRSFLSGDRAAPPRDPAARG